MPILIHKEITSCRMWVCMENGKWLSDFGGPENYRNKFENVEFLRVFLSHNFAALLFQLPLLYNSVTFIFY